MKTFLAWLIANIESATTLIVVVAYEFFVLSSPDLADNRATLATIGVIILVMAKSLIGGIPSKNTLTDIVNLVFLVVVVILVFMAIAQFESFRHLMPWAICTCCIALPLSVSVATFTARNFLEVVSRRMLYVNSNVDLFEVKWMYTFNRFVSSLSSISSLGLLAILGKMLLMELS